ncbi:MAG: biotin-dependent carboxyltransferase family protein [Chitinophagaceae bacterium]
MNLRIIKGGVLDTVQDMGRAGWRHFGINPAGVMDKFSAQVANILVGNDRKEAVIEIHFPASSFFFEQPTLISLSGADFSASINGDEVPLLHPILVSKYSILQFHESVNGARAYLAVHGGLNLSKWLDSYSTNLNAGAGGHLGRALQKDDEIGFRLSKDFCPYINKQEFIVLPWKAGITWNGVNPGEIYVLPGNEWNWLTEDSKEKIKEQLFIVTIQSDRMGYQLSGDPLLMNKKEEVVSSGVDFGTIQLLPDGQLIVLMADHQTTGGYPRIGHVISAHHNILAQMKPGSAIQFRMTDLLTAEELFLNQEQHLMQLQNACAFRMDNYFKE